MNAKKLDQSFRTIYAKHGALTPEIVVSEARNKRHELHHLFDWDDRSAAHAYRLSQAADLIRSVEVVTVMPSGKHSLRQWHAVKAAGAADAPDGYVPLDEVTAEPLFKAALLQQMERDWKALAGRYKCYLEFWTMVENTKAETPAKRRSRKATGHKRAAKRKGRRGK